MPKHLFKICVLVIFATSIVTTAYAGTPIMASSASGFEKFFLAIFKGIFASIIALWVFAITAWGQLLIWAFKYTYGFEKLDIGSISSIDELEPISIALILKLVVPLLGIPLAFLLMMFSGITDNPGTVRLFATFLIIACLLDIFSEAVAVISLYFGFVGYLFSGTFDVMTVFNFIVTFAGHMPSSISDTATAISAIGFAIGLGSTWMALFSTDTLDSEKTEIISNFLNKITGGLWDN